MKKTAMNQDELAKFIVQCMSEIKHYQFDLLYDISKIVKLFNENRGHHETPIFKTFNLMLRSTGSDLIDPMDENYSIYENRTDKIYKLEFCWNRDYFNIPFCYVTQIQ